MRSDGRRNAVRETDSAVGPMQIARCEENVRYHQMHPSPRLSLAHTVLNPLNERPLHVLFPRERANRLLSVPTPAHDSVATHVESSNLEPIAHLEESVQINTLCVERSADMVDRVLQCVIFRHKVNQSLYQLACRWSRPIHSHKSDAWKPPAALV